VQCDEYPEFSVVGHSVGGKVAMLIALMFPHRVTRLVSVDGTRDDVVPIR